MGCIFTALEAFLRRQHVSLFVRLRQEFSSTLQHMAKLAVKPLIGPFEWDRRFVQSTSKFCLPISKPSLCSTDMLDKSKGFLKYSIWCARLCDSLCEQPNQLLF